MISRRGLDAHCCSAAFLMTALASACSSDGHNPYVAGPSTGNGGNGGSAAGGSGGSNSGGKGGSNIGGNGAGGTGAGGKTTNTGGTSGNGAGGAAVGDGGKSGTGGSTSTACPNPTHVLPLNPADPQDGITIGSYYVDTDTWNAANYQVTQTMYVCDAGNWYVIANMNDDAHDGAVKTYPNVHQDFGAAPSIGSLGTSSTTFAHAGPHVGIYEFAYDIWLDGVAGPNSTEIMIWTDNHGQVPSGSVVDTVTFGTETYDVYKSGHYIAFVDQKNITSGTIDLLAVFGYAIQKTWISATSTLGAVDYGVELVSTGGADATFSVTDFSLTTN